MQKYIYSILISCLALIFLDCGHKYSSHQKIDEDNIIQPENNNVLDILCQGCDGDTITLSRILYVSPEYLKDVKNGKIKPSEEFNNRVLEIGEIYLSNGENFSKLIASQDPNHKWYNVILWSPINHPWCFWPITIFFFLVVIYRATIIYYLDRADLKYDFMTADNVDLWHDIIKNIPIIGLCIECLLFLIAFICYLISSN